MLTQRDLTLLRAALSYFDEEMSPHDGSVMSPYIQPPLIKSPDRAEFAGLRSRLQQCQLQYLCFDAKSSWRHEFGLDSSYENAERIANRYGGYVASVLSPLKPD